jgi:hypothetical protein
VALSDGAAPLGQGIRGTEIGHQPDHEEVVDGICDGGDGLAEVVRAFLLEPWVASSRRRFLLDVDWTGVGSGWLVGSLGLDGFSGRYLNRSYRENLPPVALAFVELRMRFCTVAVVPGVVVSSPRADVRSGRFRGFRVTFTTVFVGLGVGTVVVVLLRIGKAVSEDVQGRADGSSDVARVVCEDLETVLDGVVSVWERFVAVAGMLLGDTVFSSTRPSSV